MEHYKTALKIKPDLAGAHLNMGVYFRREGKLDDAINHFSKVLHGKSNDAATAQCELGNTLEKKGDLSRAAKHYLEAINIRPGYAKAYNKLGVILASQNKVKAAIVFLSKALQINPGYSGAHFNTAKKPLNRPQDSVKQLNFINPCFGCPCCMRLMQRQEGLMRRSLLLSA